MTLLIMSTSEPTSAGQQPAALRLTIRRVASSLSLLKAPLILQAYRRPRTAARWSSSLTEQTLGYRANVRMAILSFWATQGARASTHRRHTSSQQTAFVSISQNSAVLDRRLVVSAGRISTSHPIPARRTHWRWTPLFLLTKFPSTLPGAQLVMSGCSRSVLRPYQPFNCLRKAAT